MQPTSVMEVKLQVTLDIIHMTLLELDYQITDQITYMQAPPTRNNVRVGQRETVSQFSAKDKCIITNG